MELTHIHALVCQSMFDVFVSMILNIVICILLSFAQQNPALLIGILLLCAYNKSGYEGTKNRVESGAFLYNISFFLVYLFPCWLIEISNISNTRNYRQSNSNVCEKYQTVFYGFQLNCKDELIYLSGFKNQQFKTGKSLCTGITTRESALF